MDVVGYKRIFRADGRWLLPLIAGEHVLPPFQPLQNYDTQIFYYTRYLKSHHICIDQLPEVKNLSTF